MIFPVSLFFISHTHSGMLPEAFTSTICLMCLSLTLRGSPGIRLITIKISVPGRSPAIENLSDFHHQFHVPERLLKECATAFSHQVPDLVVGAVPACQNDLHLRVDPPEKAEGLLAVHFGHDHVQNNKGDFAAVTAVDFQGLFSVPRRNHRVALTFQDLPIHVEYHVLVIHEQNCFSTLEDPRM